jgi:hypothetical protein
MNVGRKIRLFDDGNEIRLDPLWRWPKAVRKAESAEMNRDDAERWKKLERRARERGWTIDLLEVGPAGGKSARKREFALMELSGDERALVTGDLDTIEAFL